MKLSIVEGNGWSKTVLLEKAIVRVGSALGNDVQLAAPGIAPIHLQILNSANLPTGCRVINLASPLVLHNRGVKKILETYANVDLVENDEIQVGEYRLTFHLPMSAGLVRQSSSIEASLVFSSAVLSPDYPLEGHLLIKNTGGSNNCQCRVAVKGLPSSCFQVDPVPLLYSSAQEDVRVRVFHLATQPPAGMTDVYFHISAPDSYPGEEIVIRQGIFVAPLYQQELALQDDLHPIYEPAPELPAIPARILPVQPQPVRAPAPAPRAAAEPNPLPTKPEVVPPPDGAAVEPSAAAPPSARQRSRPAARTARVYEQALEADSFEPLAAPPAPAPAESAEPRAALIGSLPVEPHLPAHSAGIEAAELETPIASIPAAGPAAEPQPEPEPEPLPVERQPKPARALPVQDVSKLKVVRDQPDDFWDEG